MFASPTRVQGCPMRRNEKELHVMNKKRTGFTLVELLVVIAIIGMLVALILPAVNAARESGRRTTCLNNQKQIATALLGNEMNKGKFTGYTKKIWDDPAQPDPRVGVYGSWVVSILPNVERRDIYDDWAQGTAQPAPYLGFFVCPSDPPAGTDDPWLSYVVNCGLPDELAPTPGPNGPNGTTPYDWKTNGIFHEDIPNAPSPGLQIRKTKVRLEDISKHDGSTNTLMLSENIGANQWDATWLFTGTGQSPGECEGGFVWDYQDLPPSDPTEILDRPINRDRIQREVIGAAEVELARPSSRHPGGVIVAFADGHTQFLSEEIDHLVYGLLCSPHGKKTKEPGSSVRLRDLGLPISRYADETLKESDYKQ